MGERGSGNEVRVLGWNGNTPRFGERCVLLFVALRRAQSVLPNQMRTVRRGGVVTLME